MRYTLTLLFVLTIVSLHAQSIKYTYDDAGNRSKREYLVSSEPNNDQNEDNNQNISENVEKENEVISLEDNSKPARIYPNPTIGGITVDLGSSFKKDSKQQLEVLDINGKVVQLLNVVHSISAIEFGGYRSGLYYIHLKEEGLIIQSWKISKID